MKRSLLFLTLFLLLPLPSYAEEKNSLAMSEWARRFDNLTPEEKNDYIQHSKKARRFFEQKRIFESLESVGQAQAIYLDDPNMWNLKGSCYMEFRDFVQAAQCFKNTLQLNPNSNASNFNLGEIYYVTAQWEKCLELFTKLTKNFEQLLEKMEKEHSEASAMETEFIDSITARSRKLLAIEKRQKTIAQMIHVSRFKMFVSYRKLGNINSAEEISSLYTELDDSPFFYYAKAVKAFENNENQVASESLGQAKRIFKDETLIHSWQDSLVEAGYLVSFYGDNNEDNNNLMDL